MDARIFFNPANFIYWTALGLIIWQEAKRTPASWSEAQRFWLGWSTLFGGGLGMVVWGGFDFYTWLTLALASAAARLVGLDTLILSDLWARRENHRWTLVYFAAFVLGLLPVLWANMDVLTWGALFAGLGVCGAVKVGYPPTATARRPTACGRCGTGPGRPEMASFQNDRDWEYLDQVIALCDDISAMVNGERRYEGIKEISDDPKVLYLALKVEAAALVIRKASREYRPRLRELKEMERRLNAGNAQPPQG